MRLEEIVLHPAMLHAMLAVSLALCLFLFVSLKRDLWRADKRWKARVEALEASLQAKTEEVKIEAPDDRRTETRETPNKRSQALQMLRRGVPPEEVAATLSLHLNEVELLVKVNELALSRVTES